MPSHKSTIYLIAGCNGAGKTTFAREFLPKEVKCLRFLNADEIARGLSPLAPDAGAVKAARVLLRELHEAIKQRDTFALETTLSGLTYVRLLRQASRRGYTLNLHYLWLTSTGLSEASMDLVVTDPPFFDNVHYSELADFFFAWQQLSPSPFLGKQSSTRHVEEVQDTSAEQFAAKLRSVFVECHRVLREDGLLVFTYHHSRMDGWTSLADAVVGAGFSLINCHPIKSEMSVAAPKSQAKEPIQLDIILVCRKQTADSRGKCNARLAFELAVEHAISKTNRLKTCDLKLSVNDRRVILISQFLVEACAGRSADQLSDEISRSLADLDLAAMQLHEPVVYKTVDQTKGDVRQLAFLEKARTRQVSTLAQKIPTRANYRKRRHRSLRKVS
jgi:hypothetical protein